jgi:L,D-transpeptidase YbiS
MSEPMDYGDLHRDLAVVIAPPRLPRLLAVGGGLALLLGFLAIAGYGTGYAFAPAADFEVPSAAGVPTGAAELKRLRASLVKQNAQFGATLAKAAPKGNYVVIDQTQNRIYLMKDGAVVHGAVCSAGSGIVLKDFSGQRKWVFDTPRGVFKVRNRVENPAWRKPDWAFIEEGKPVPKNPSERIEYGTLGEYALYLEDGYMIHGTLYERLLGRSVSHGCVRVGRDDLRVFWKNVPMGTPVYIF